MLPAGPACWSRTQSEVLDLIDGLVLAGGADIDPASYGRAAIPRRSTRCPSAIRFEIALTRAAIERDLPVLGICRGMQLINVALRRHAASAPARALRPRRAPPRVGLVRRRRPRRDAERGLAGRAAPRASSHHATKSHHHQGVDRLGEGLVVSGLSTLDGLPEAIELPGQALRARRAVAPGGRRRPAWSSARSSPRRAAARAGAAAERLPTRIGRAGRAHILSPQCCGCRRR